GHEPAAGLPRPADARGRAGRAAAPARRQDPGRGRRSVRDPRAQAPARARRVHSRVVYRRGGAGGDPLRGNRPGPGHRGPAHAGPGRLRGGAGGARAHRRHRAHPGGLRRGPLFGDAPGARVRRARLPLQAVRARRGAAAHPQPAGAALASYYLVGRRGGALPRPGGGRQRPDLPDGRGRHGVVRQPRGHGAAGRRAGGAEVPGPGAPRPARRGARLLLRSAAPPHPHHHARDPPGGGREGAVDRAARAARPRAGQGAGAHRHRPRRHRAAGARAAQGRPGFRGEPRAADAAHRHPREPWPAVRRGAAGVPGARGPHGAARARQRRTAGAADRRHAGFGEAVVGEDRDRPAPLFPARDRAGDGGYRAAALRAGRPAAGGERARDGGVRGPGPRGPGAHQPGVERRQVLPPRRHRVDRCGRGGRRPAPARARPRPRHPRGQAGVDLRALPAGGLVRQPREGRHGAGAPHLPQHREAARRQSVGGEHPREGEHLHGSLPGGCLDGGGGV
ncbi:MAG: diguanylate cyclase/phosphodiesterase (GGDEF & EAL domains) with PAS/PAC sensor(s), partial [uncultured Gemmatimonadetes bacterium]